MVGEPFLVGIDGRSGSGKTTLAGVLADSTGARVVHLDDLYAGWSGLAGVETSLEALLTPLRAGHAGTYRRWDWHASSFAETVRVEPAPMLVVEGVGAASWRDYDVLVWCDAPVGVRRERALARDGETFAPHWDQWARDEDALFDRIRPWERADVTISC